MKIPEFQPDLSKEAWLQRYQRLQNGADQILEKEWVDLAMVARLDPRFAEIWVRCFSVEWKRLSPVCMNALVRKSSWPAVFGVLLDFVSFRISPEDQNHFRLFKKSVFMSIPKSDFQQFFIGVISPGSEMMWQDTVMPSKIFLKWGFFGRDDLSGLRKNRTRTDLSRETRLKMAKNWIKGKSRFKVSDYLNLFSGRINPRQAQRDIASFFPEFQKKGQTRGAVYVRIPKAR